MTKKSPLNDLMRHVGERLPEGYEICISMRRGEADIEITTPSGERLDYCDDDLTPEEAVWEAVQVARADIKIKAAIAEATRNP